MGALKEQQGTLTGKRKRCAEQTQEEIRKGKQMRIQTFFANTANTGGPLAAAPSEEHQTAQKT